MPPSSARERPLPLTTADGRASLAARYVEQLDNDTIAFWLSSPHFVDREHGGFRCALGRQGELLDTDKGMWQQARTTWTFAALYNRLERRSLWLELAEHGMDFIDKYGFDASGQRMFFRVTEQGRPLVQRRYVYTEVFTAMASAELARATSDQRRADDAIRLYELCRHYITTPGLLPAKTDPQTRSWRALAVPMILMNCAQVLRENLGERQPFTTHIDEYIEQIARNHVNDELETVLESVGTDGTPQLAHFDGRITCPGHSLEAAWFILHEFSARPEMGDLRDLGLKIVDWMWRSGWDEKFGGILYYRDALNLPVQEYWQDMKFWWVHNEASLATLLAYLTTGDTRYAANHSSVEMWTERHFHDTDHGEWFGYLHRDGRVSVDLKGNLWKAPYHLPRMQLLSSHYLQNLSPPNKRSPK